MLDRYFDGQVTVEQIARKAGVTPRTVWRKIKARQEKGLNGLQRMARSDKGKRRKLESDLHESIEGLYLRVPKPTVVWVHEQITEACKRGDRPVPGYTVVWEICRDLDRRLKVLAHEGDAAYEQEYDILIRREAERPNEVWQSDHKELKVWAVDEFGKIGKVWLTCILDDYSRVVPGYFLDVRTPNSSKIASALRQAIWVKNNEKWPVSGIPDVFYSDQGRDFKSTHIQQAAADLGMRLVRTIKRKPRGRGKIERFFRTVDQRFSHKLESSPTKPLPLKQVIQAFHEWLIDDYHNRKHRELKTTPLLRWRDGAFLPRLPDSFETLDLMLHKVAKPRKMWGEGIRFKGYRYSDMSLSESRQQEFTIRYDPRDLSCIYVYGDEGKLVCKAACSELTGESPSSEAIIAERLRVKRKLKKTINDRRLAADALLEQLKATIPIAPPQPPAITTTQPIKLRKYFHERK